MPDQSEDRRNRKVPKREVIVLGVGEHIVENKPLVDIKISTRHPEKWVIVDTETLECYKRTDDNNLRYISDEERDRLIKILQEGKNRSNIETVKRPEKTKSLKDINLNGVGTLADSGWDH